VIVTFLVLIFPAYFTQYFNVILCIHSACCCRKITRGHQTSGHAAGHYVLYLSM